jgi:hypothetical protein
MLPYNFHILCSENWLDGVEMMLQFVGAQVSLQKNVY